MHKRIQRLTTLALACALILSLLPMAVPKAGAASTSTLSNVTESYVDASDGTQISKDETYSVTHIRTKTSVISMDIPTRPSVRTGL